MGVEPAQQQAVGGGLVRQHPAHLLGSVAATSSAVAAAAGSSGRGSSGGTPVACGSVSPIRGSRPCPPGRPRGLDAPSRGGTRALRRPRTSRATTRRASSSEIRPARRSTMLPVGVEGAQVPPGGHVAGMQLDAETGGARAPRVPARTERVVAEQREMSRAGARCDPRADRLEEPRHALRREAVEVAASTPPRARCRAPRPPCRPGRRSRPGGSANRCRWRARRGPPGDATPAWAVSPWLVVARRRGLPSALEAAEDGDQPEQDDTGDEEPQRLLEPEPGRGVLLASEPQRPQQRGARGGTPSCARGTGS